MMTTLANLEKQFQNYLLYGDTTFQAEIEDTKDFKADERLLVYFQAYRLRLINALEKDYAKVASLLGDDFEALALAYIAAYPSKYRSMINFSCHLADFCRETAAYAQHAALIEMIEFEATFNRALISNNAQSLDLAELGQLKEQDWPMLKVALHPSVAHQRCIYNTGATWKALEEETAIPTANELPEPLDWLIWRRDTHIYYRSISKTEFEIFQQFQNQQTLADICDTLSQSMPADAVPTQCVTALQQWLLDGLIIKLIY